MTAMTVASAAETAAVAAVDVDATATAAVAAADAAGCGNLHSSVTAVMAALAVLLRPLHLPSPLSAKCKAECDLSFSLRSNPRVGEK